MTLFFLGRIAAAIRCTEGDGLAVTGNDCAGGDRTSHGSASARPLQTECQVSGTIPTVGWRLDTILLTSINVTSHFTAF